MKDNFTAGLYLSLLLPHVITEVGRLHQGTCREITQDTFITLPEPEPGTPGHLVGVVLQHYLSGVRVIDIMQSLHSLAEERSRRVIVV